MTSNDNSVELHGLPITHENAKLINTIIAKADKIFTHGNIYRDYSNLVDDFFAEKINKVYLSFNKEEQKYLLLFLLSRFQKKDYYNPIPIERAFKLHMEDLISASKFDSNEVYDLIKRFLDNTNSNKLTHERVCSIFSLFRNKPLETSVKNAFLDSKLALDKWQLSKIINDCDLDNFVRPTQYTPRRFTIFVLQVAAEDKSYFSSFFISQFIKASLQYYPKDIPLLESLLQLSYTNQDLTDFQVEIHLIESLKNHPDITEKKWNKIIYKVYSHIKTSEEYFALRPYMSDEIVDQITSKVKLYNKLEGFIYAYERKEFPPGISTNYYTFEELCLLGDRIPLEWQKKLVNRAVKRIEKTLTMVNPHPDFAYCLLFLDKVSPETVKGYFSLPKVLDEALRDSTNARTYFNLAEKYNMIDELGFKKYGGK